LALQKVHWISTNSDNRMCATNGAGTAYISIALDIRYNIMW
jgi:hypothetical protein